MNTPITKNFNSLLPLGVPAANAINTLRNNVNMLNKTVNDMVENTQRNMNTAAESVGLPGGWMTALGIFMAFLVLFIFILSYYSAQVKQGYDYMITQIRGFLGFEQKPFGLPELPGQDVLDPSVAPQNQTEAEKDATKPLVEKVLPNTGASEVFNVSKNTFTYYDAEPLCKALGAELATYDQVKQAWERGADWCNYGWVKGQTAVYPTQKDSFDKLQAGPEDQRLACGVTGLNGGYFDNPELRFGVNCYGPKPSQSDHDAIAQAKGTPLSPEALEVQKKVAKFRTEASSLGILPFNTSKWSTS
jgi:hypothetical protein